MSQQPFQPSNEPERFPKRDGNTDFRVSKPAQGIEWLRQAWLLFKKNPGVWLSCTLVMNVILIILLVIPFLAPFSFIAPTVFIGGLMIGCQKLRLNHKFTLNHLFAGFELHLFKLAVIGGVYFMASILVYVLAMTIAVSMGHEIIKPDINTVMTNEAEMMAFIESLLFPMLIMLVLMIPVIMALWFAPALTVLKEVPPTKAIKKSFIAVAHNILPFLVFVLTALISVFVVSWILGMLITMLPALGLIVNVLFHLIFTSIVIASMYVSFIDVFPLHPEELEQQEETASDSFIV